ncbi:MAG: DUF2029 domain-containing protein [Candidatus Kerfeldbacteria bacterium]|nr:DUF2029 domain-containing protein [Candidatus Kerfeldbacteria bacterium]
MKSQIHFPPHLYLLCSAAVIVAFMVWVLASGADGHTIWQSGRAHLGGTLAVLALLFVLFLRSLPEQPVLTLKTVILGMALLAMPFLAAEPLTTSDVFAYGYYGRLVTVHHQNPFTIASTTEINDPYLTLTNADKPYKTTYGPFWISLSAAVTSVAKDNVALAIAAFRLLNILALIGVVLGLWRLCSWDASGRWLVAAVAWNPLVLFETVQNVHNDIIMTALVVAALVAYDKKKDWAVLPILTIGSLIKYLPALLIPLAVIAILTRGSWRGALRSLVLGCAISAALTVAAFLPYWNGVTTFVGLFRLQGFWALPFFHPLGILALLFRTAGVSQFAAEAQARDIGVAVVVMTLVVLGIVLAVRKLKFATAVAFVFAAMVLCGVTYFQPWYLLWLLPLAPFLPRRWAQLTLAIGTVVPLATYVAFASS